MKVYIGTEGATPIFNPVTDTLHFQLLEPNAELSGYEILRINAAEREYATCQEILQDALKRGIEK
jgi:hypothetical protein